MSDTNNTHEQLINAINSYISENDKFTEKNTKAAAPRARKALQEMIAAAKLRRKEISAEKEAIGPKITPKA